MRKTNVYRDAYALTDKNPGSHPSYLKPLSRPGFRVKTPESHPQRKGEKRPRTIALRHNFPGISILTQGGTAGRLFTQKGEARQQLKRWISRLYTQALEEMKDREAIEHAPAASKNAAEGQP